MNRDTKIALGLTAAVSSGVVWYAASIPHDEYYGAYVDGGVTNDITICHYYEPGRYPDGTILASMRADSYKCGYAKANDNTIAIVGGSNEPCNKQMDMALSGNGIFISNGCDCGDAVDFLIPSPSQSESTAIASEGIRRVREAGNDWGRYVYDIRAILHASDGRANEGCGEPVDWDRAVELAAATSTPVNITPINIAPIVSYILL